MQTLSQKDKVIFLILVLCFAIPEAVWGGLQRQLYSLYGYVTGSLQIGGSFDLLNEPNTRDFFTPIFYFQFLSIFLAFVLLVYKRKEIRNRTAFWIGVTVTGGFAVLALIVCIAANATNHVTISF